MIQIGMEEEGACFFRNGRMALGRDYIDMVLTSVAPKLIFHIFSL